MNDGVLNPEFRIKKMIPTSERLKTINIRNKVLKLKIVSQEGKIVYLEPNPELKLGNKVEFNNGLFSGIVIYLDTNLTKVLCPIEQLALSAEKINLVSFNPPDFRLNVPLVDLGSLKVQCQVPNIGEQTALGWRLTYKTNELKEYDLIFGHDYESPNICFYDGTGIWAVGSYTLYVTCYRLRGMYPVISSSTEWNVKEPLNLLSYGGYHDKEGLLIL